MSDLGLLNAASEFVKTWDEIVSKEGCPVCLWDGSNPDESHNGGGDCEIQRVRDQLVELIVERRTDAILD